MAFLLKSNFLGSASPQNLQSTRGLHIEAGPREKALLAPDPAFDSFKSYRKGVRRIKMIGDVLTVAVVAGCCYEIYVRATMREEARKQAGGSEK